MVRCSGVLVCLAFRYIDIRLFERFALVGYVLVVLLVAAFVGKGFMGLAGVDWGGCCSTSELMKVALILALARFSIERKARRSTPCVIW